MVSRPAVPRFPGKIDTEECPGQPSFGPTRNLGWPTRETVRVVFHRRGDGETDSGTCYSERAISPLAELTFGPGLSASQRGLLDQSAVAFLSE